MVQKKNLPSSQMHPLTGKIPPQCIDIESSLLGTLIFIEGAIHKIDKFFNPDYFFKKEHALIAIAIKELFLNDEPIELVTVSEKLRIMGKLEEAGGVPFLVSLDKNIHSAANIEYYMRIVQQYWLKRFIIQTNSEIINAAFDETSDSLELVERMNEFVEKINEFKAENTTEKQVDAVDSVSEIIFSNAEGKRKIFWKSGHEKIDNILNISPNNILLIGGAAKQMKTRFTINLFNGLMNRNNDISILWYTLEDGKTKLVQVLLTTETKIPEEYMLSKNHILTTEERNRLQGSINELKKRDIEYVEDPKPIKYITSHFRTFCKARPNRFNILIIDNALLVSDKESDRDDLIMNEISKCRQATKGLIVVIHHFNDEQMNTDRIKEAFRPSLKHLKGREAYRRVPTQVLLINMPGKYPELVAEYIGKEDILKHLFLVEIAANRHGTGGGGEETFIRYFVYPEFNAFKEIS